MEVVEEKIAEAVAPEEALGPDEAKNGKHKPMFSAKVDPKVNYVSIDGEPEFDQEEVSFLEKSGRTFYQYRSYTSEGGVEWIDVKDVLEFTFSDAATKEAIKKLNAGKLGVSVNERKRVHWMHEGRAKSGPGRVVTSRPNIHKLLWKFFDQRRSRRSWDEIVAKLFDENAPEEVVEGRNGEAEVQ